MNEKTINGKSLAAVSAELAAAFPEERLKKRDDTGYCYYDVDTYMDRLNAVVGVMHYNVEYPHSEVKKIGDEWEIMVLCRITLFSDALEPICVKENLGGSSVAFPKLKDNSGKEMTDELGQKLYAKRPVDFINRYNSAASDAFKRTCQSGFAMAGELKTLNNSKNKGQSSANGNNIVTVRLNFLSPFMDRKNSRGEVIARHAECADETGVAVRFIVWNKKANELKQKPGINGKNLYDSLEAHINTYVTKGKTVAVTVAGYYTDYKNEHQFILNDVSLK